MIAANRIEYSAVEERILQSAEALFAEKGFKGTSLREITGRAGCNIAAVNYHFHGKEKLYISVFQRYIRTVTVQRLFGLKEILSQGVIGLTLEGFLHGLADSFLQHFLTSEQGRLGFRLLLQERKEPHLPEQMLFHEVVEPLGTIIRKSLTTLCPFLSAEQANQCMHSLVAQLIYTLHAHYLFEGMDKEQMSPVNLEKTLEHIVQFTTAGILQYQPVSG